MMQHRNVKRRQRAVNAQTKSHSFFYRTWWTRRSTHCGCFTPQRPFCHLTHRHQEKSFPRAAKWQEPTPSEIALMGRRKSKTRAEHTQLLKLIPSKFGLGSRRHERKPSDEPLPASPLERSSTEEQTDGVSVEELLPSPSPEREVAASDNPFLYQTNNPVGNPAVDLAVGDKNSLPRATARHRLTAKGSGAQGTRVDRQKCRPAKRRKRSRSIRNGNKARSLLMRYKRLSLFDIHYRYRIQLSRHGNHRKGRKAKHLSRVSTQRGKKLRSKVLCFLSDLNPESRNLTTGMNCASFLRLRKKTHSKPRLDEVDCSQDTMVQETPVSAETELRCVPENGPCVGQTQSGNCGEPNSKTKPASQDAVEKRAALALGAGKRTRKRSKKAKGAESADMALVNGMPGSGTGQTNESTALEHESPQGSDPFKTQLSDHRYCKSVGVAAPHRETEGEASTCWMEGAAQRPLIGTASTDEEIRELIHDFLEEFFGKYGSFIPLSKSDVLEHLNMVLKKDLSERQSFIYTEVKKYQAGLANAPMHYFKVTYNKHTLTLEDLSTLEGHNWLNDQVINMYGELIMDSVNNKVHFFNSFFHRQLVTKGYEGVKRWTKKVDLFTKTLLLIPIHLEIHWSLITVDITNQNIQFYDSQGIHFRYPVENILKYILTEAKEKKKVIFQKGWKMIVSKCIPQQKNDSDCGVFVLQYCKCLALGKPFHFSQEDMPRVRKRIYKELCECRLLD
ncbi:sentrin-specific protease 5 isoform X2 [Amia ocellicauda]